MNNEPEVVMSSSPISKCQQSKTQSSTSSSTKKLTLVVDKTRFICNALIFNQHPNTLLGKMFSPHLLNRQGKYIFYIILWCPRIEGFLDFVNLFIPNTLAESHPENSARKYTF